MSLAATSASISDSDRPRAEQAGLEQAAKTRQRYILWGAVIATLIVRLAVVAHVYPVFLNPEQDHWLYGYEMGHVAYSIATGQGFANPYWGPIGLSVKIPPLYAYFMAAVFKVFGVWSTAGAIFILGVGSLFSALTCIPIYLVSKELLSARAGLYAAWIWVFFPPALYFASDRMWYFSWAAFLVIFMIWCGFRLGSSTNIWAWVGFGALAGVASLLNPVILTIFPFTAGWAAWRLWKNGRRWNLQAGACLLMFMAALAPWLIRNYRVFHKPVFIRDDFWLEFYVGNVGNWVYRWNGSIHPSVNSAELQEYIQMGELPYMELKKQQAIAYIEANPGTFIVRSIRRAIYVWTGFWSIHSEYGSPRIGRFINLCYLGLTVLGLMGLWKAYRQEPAKAVLVAIVLFVFPGVYYITHIEMGYRHPLDPILLALAIYALLPARAAVREEAHDGALGVASRMQFDL